MKIKNKLKTVPNEPGAYLIQDAEGKPIYVGKAQSLRKRLQQHFRESGRAGPWHEVMIQRAADFDFIITHSPAEALLLESTLIKQHRPRFNLRLADDKSYPLLMLTEEIYPRLVLLRDLPSGARPGGRGRRVARGLHDPKRKSVHSLREGEIFGPYPEAKSMRRTMQLASRLFGLRSCKKELSGEPVGKPCLNYHIKRCVGPCTGEVSPEEYQQIVSQVRRFLKGRTGEIVTELQEQMDRAAEHLEFEHAALLRDRLRALERATRGQVVVSNRLLEQDIAAVASAEEGLAVVALLRVRHGRLVGREEYVLRETENHRLAEMLEAFLSQHYSRAHWAPRELLLCTEVENAEEWEQMLSELRGSRVTVRRPQRGAGRKLLELAERNAAAALVQAQAAQQRREGRAVVALEDVQELLDLARPPQRIEGYDISNVQGDHATASLVVFTGGRPDKQNYRRFRIRTPGPDDYAMIAEALRRRLQRAAEGDPKFLPPPDLILVDGGKGQVAAAQRALQQAGAEDLPLVGLAKREEQVFVPGRKNPLPVEEHQAAQYLLQHVRDEAHRFALSYHQGLRQRAMIQSELDAVPGIGPRRRQALLQAFPSVHDMARASEEELAAVPSMNRAVARTLKRYLMNLIYETPSNGEDSDEEDT